MNFFRVFKKNFKHALVRIFCRIAAEYDDLLWGGLGGDAAGGCAVDHQQQFSG